MKHQRRYIFDTSEIFDYDHVAWHVDRAFRNRVRVGGRREYIPNAGLLPWNGRNDVKTYEQIGIIGQWLKETITP